MLRYRTVLKDAAAEQIIERSRFIGHVRPVESKEEAEAFFAEIRSLHKDATHNAPAFVIGEQCNLQWASDDGEPQGTAGAPMARMLVKEGLTNLAVIVTRYFGGTKLGTGGLVRAYTGTAKMTLEAAGVCAVKDLDVLRVKMEYSHYGKIQNLAASGEFQLRDAVFEDRITLELAAAPEDTDKLRTLLANLSGGDFEELEHRRELVKIPE